MYFFTDPEAHGTEIVLSEIVHKKTFINEKQKKHIKWEK